MKYLRSRAVIMVMVCANGRMASAGALARVYLLLLHVAVALHVLDRQVASVLIIRKATSSAEASFCSLWATAHREGLGQRLIDQVRVLWHLKRHLLVCRRCHGRCSIVTAHITRIVAIACAIDSHPALMLV